MMTTSGTLRAFHLANLGEGVEAVAVGQPDVEQDDIVGGVAEQFEGLSRGGGGGDEVVLFAEDALERFADLGFVVDDEYVVHLVSREMVEARFSSTSGAGTGSLCELSFCGFGLGVVAILCGGERTSGG